MFMLGLYGNRRQNFITTLSMLEQAKKAGTKIAFSLSDPWVAATFTDQLKQLCDFGIDLLFCNDAEAMAFTGTNSVEAADSINNVYPKTL